MRSRKRCGAPFVPHRSGDFCLVRVGPASLRLMRLRRHRGRLSRLWLVLLVLGVEVSMAELSTPSQFLAVPSVVPWSPPNASSESRSFLQKLPSLLTSESCNVMLRDPKRLFLSMWSPVATGWLGRGPSADPAHHWPRSPSRPVPMYVIRLVEGGHVP